MADARTLRPVRPGSPAPRLACARSALAVASFRPRRSAMPSGAIGRAEFRVTKKSGTGRTHSHDITAENMTVIYPASPRASRAGLRGRSAAGRTARRRGHSTEPLGRATFDRALDRTCTMTRDRAGPDGPPATGARNRRGVKTSPERGRRRLSCCGTDEEDRAGVGPYSVRRSYKNSPAPRRVHFAVSYGLVIFRRQWNHAGGA